MTDNNGAENKTPAQDESVQSLLMAAGLENPEVFIETIMGEEEEDAASVSDKKKPAAQSQSKQSSGNDPEDDDDEEEDEDSDDPFGMSGKKGKKEPLSEVPKEVVEFLEKKIGKPHDKVFEMLDSVPDLIERAEYADRVKNEISVMPSPLKAAFNAYLNGEDIVEAFQKEKERPDYSKSFSDQAAQVAKYYAPDEVSDLEKELEDEEIDQSEFDRQIAKIARLKKDSFTNDQERYKKSIKDIADSAAKEKKDLTDSIDASIKDLKSRIPSFKDTDKIRAIMLQGPEAVTKLLSDNGAFTKDAALRLSFMINPEVILKKLEEAVEKRGSTKANVKIYKNSSKEVHSKSRGADAQGADDLPNEAKSLLSLGLKKRTY